MENQNYFIASDHAGFLTKNIMLRRLGELRICFEDFGPFSEERVDYPDFADKVCLKLKDNPMGRGILVCGSGQGMAMRANKYSHIRAALCWNTESAKLARQHNDANVLCLGGRLLEKQMILDILDVFVKEDFEGGRHKVRVEKLNQPIL